MLLLGSHPGVFSAALRRVLEEKLDRGLAPLRSLIEGSKRITTTIGSLVEVANPSATQILVLTRTVKQLSGQLISEAKRNREQQELLDKTWEKLSTLPQSPQSPQSPQDNTHTPTVQAICCNFLI